MKYFAYGSNMSLRRLQQRTPSAVPIGLFFLAGHDLRFHKVGQDGSAKCDAFYTGSVSDRVYGRLFEIAEQEKYILDHAEGLGAGYEAKLVSVVNDAGFAVNAAIYYATDIDTWLKPFSWYKEHVLIGARECKLAPDYIQKIIRIETIEDPDKYRCAQQRAIYK
ncbi:gamma-glutamylcyclotransferase family protein [Thalassomonas sp. RHCl1]|uniref:gamma-glutamylcyclotransferase family protein n=1 Tax=Thalassomonas sp. RHCl1 TaxID=2995320 RepID=UPI00248D023E|nr:gamma-glutamylcyclotransferase family protein [Thalassomonas sp. RHCl1]